MTGPSAAGRAGTADNVVGVEVTIDGMLVIADRLHLVDFPVTLGIRPNIPQEDLRDIVWEQVQRDLTAQGVLDLHGEPQPTVAEMVETLGRPDRTLEGRWWRRDIGGVMVRFVVCRRGDRHVIAARDGDMLVLQLVAPQVGLAGMVTAVLGPAEPANVEPLTGVATELAECTTASQLTQYGIAPASARVYAEIVGNPTGWVEIVASQRHPGGTTTQTDAAAGVLDSKLGRLVSLPRRVGGDLYGSFLPGTQQNLERALDGLLELLPAGAWLDPHLRSRTSLLPRLTPHISATTSERDAMVDPPGNDDDHGDLDALDFSAAHTNEASPLDALDDYAPVQTDDAEGDLDALHALTERDEEPELELFTVTNPQGSVSVSTLMDGRIQHVELTDKATSMSEAQLADEIFVIADLARQKARASQYTFMVENIGELTDEDAEGSALLREFVGMTLNLPTPEEAAAAEAEVFATRYDVDYTSRYKADD